MKYRVITETSTSTEIISNHRSLKAAAKAAVAACDWMRIAYVMDDEDRRLKEVSAECLAEGWMYDDEAEWFE